MECMFLYILNGWLIVLEKGWVFIQLNQIVLCYTLNKMSFKVGHNVWQQMK